MLLYQIAGNASYLVRTSSSDCDLFWWYLGVEWRESRYYFGSCSICNPTLLLRLERHLSMNSRIAVFNFLTNSK